MYVYIYIYSLNVLLLLICRISSLLNISSLIAHRWVGGVRLLLLLLVGIRLRDLLLLDGVHGDSLLLGIASGRIAARRRGVFRRRDVRRLLLLHYHGRIVAGFAAGAYSELGIHDRSETNVAPESQYFFRNRPSEREKE